VENDFVLDAGTRLQTLDENKRSVTRVTPPGVPMFRQVVDHLEAKPRPADGYVRLADEARATVAVCLRWGSYFAALVDASRPFSPNAWDENTSQIADDEMARMNIEISAAIQWWLTLKGSDEQRYTQLVQRALTYLPLGRKTVTRSPEGDVLRECSTAAMAAAVRHAWHVEHLERDLRLAGTHGARAIANTITLLSWRNGPVENVHAGRRFGHRFNERRVLPQDEKAIIRQAQNVLHAALNAVEHMAFDGAWPPPPERVLPFMRPFCHPSDWSYTEQSRIVELPLSTN
jgi:hypothetical protein